MKTRTSLFAVSFSAGLLALVITGCSSLTKSHSGPDASRPIGGKSMEIIQLRDNVKATRVALNRTTDALNRISGSPAARESYTAFSMELTTFQELADKTLQQSADVRNRGRDLFAEWNAETLSINNPEIRAVAEQRRSTLESSYNEMMTPLISARADLTDVRSDLVDIQKALALDLTPAGIEAAKKPIDGINRKADASARSLDALTEELNKIVDALPAPTVSSVR